MPSRKLPCNSIPQQWAATRTSSAAIAIARTAARKTAITTAMATIAASTTETLSAEKRKPTYILWSLTPYLWVGLGRQKPEHTAGRKETANQALHVRVRVCVRVCRGCAELA